MGRRGSTSQSSERRLGLQSTRGQEEHLIVLAKPDLEQFKEVSAE